MGLTVSKWTAARRKWNYDPILQAYWRMCMFNLREGHRIEADGTPSDDALLARLWFATETKHSSPEYIFSFSFCCFALGLNEDAERLGALDLIDAVGDHDNEMCDKRLEYLLANPPDDEEHTFEGFRTVSEVDQAEIAPGIAERLSPQERKALKRSRYQSVTAAETPGAVLQASTFVPQQTTMFQ